MDNKQIARILRDTAQLLEIDGAIIGRYRSYEKAAELIDSLPESVEQFVKEPEKLEELPGIGERMVEHLQEIVKTGDYTLRENLLKKYRATILDVLQLQSFGLGDSTRPSRLLSVVVRQIAVPCTKKNFFQLGELFGSSVWDWRLLRRKILAAQVKRTAAGLQEKQCSLQKNSC